MTHISQDQGAGSHAENKYGSKPFISACNLNVDDDLQEHICIVQDARAVVSESICPIKYGGWFVQFRLFVISQRHVEGALTKKRRRHNEITKAP